MLYFKLTQVRRERDQIRESLAVSEKKLAEMRQKYETDEKGLRRDLSEYEKKVKTLLEHISLHSVH